MKKRILALTLAICLLLSLGACGEKEETTKAENTTTVSTTEATEEVTEETETTAQPTTEKTTKPAKASSGVNADFKETMDSYEEFFDDEYIWKGK